MNTLVVQNAPAKLGDDIAHWVNSLDAATNLDKRETRVYRLQVQKAAAIAQILSRLYRDMNRIRVQYERRFKVPSMNRQLADNPKNKHRVTDLHFSFTGKIVDELERAFLRSWHSIQGKQELVAFEPANPNLTQAKIWSRLVLDGPNEYLDRLNDLLVGIISTARKRVWIMTPYFLPGADIVSALVGASLRGVDVKILLPEKSNIFLVNWATQKILPYFVEKDISIYFQPPPFIHTRALIIDNNYSLIGSANFDARSLRLNFELGVEVFDPVLNSQLSSYFEAKLNNASLVTEHKTKAIPLPLRMRNAVAWLFSPYL